MTAVRQAPRSGPMLVPEGPAGSGRRADPDCRNKDNFEDLGATMRPSQPSGTDAVASGACDGQKYGSDPRPVVGAARLHRRPELPVSAIDSQNCAAGNASHSQNPCDPPQGDRRFAQ